MNKKFQKIVDVYNDGQNEWRIINIGKVDYSIVVVSEKFKEVRDCRIYIDFYEFLFNPKYRVFVTFFPNITCNYHIIRCICYQGKWKQPEEIIDYIYNEIDKR